MSGGGMKLDSLEFLRLLPQFMRDDLAAQGLSMGLDRVVHDLAESIQRLTTWDHIDELSEEELDALAWELNILWYDKGANLETKRDLVKNSDKVHKRLGTKWAVENVIQSYFGDGYVQEWFEYDGTPGYFRVAGLSPECLQNGYNQLFNLLRAVKRLSAKLDSIVMQISLNHRLYTGFAVRLGKRLSVGCEIPAELDVTYLVDETGNLLADEAGNRIIDEED